MAQKAVRGLSGYDSVLVALGERGLREVGAATVQGWLPGAEIYYVGRTENQVETVRRVAEHLDPDQPFVARDADNYIELDLPQGGNFTGVASLAEHPEVEPYSKSYAVPHGDAVLCYEKSPHGDLFNVGVYGFESAATFLKASRGLPYLSSVLGALPTCQLLLGRNFKDFGTASDWHAFTGL
jgi:hypothetical protein